MGKPDPTLNRARVEIAHGCSDGFFGTFGAKGGWGYLHPATKQPIPPERALLAGLEELARLTALFGFEDEAMKVFVDARLRVAEWKAARAKPAP